MHVFKITPHMRLGERTKCKRNGRGRPLIRELALWGGVSLSALVSLCPIFEIRILRPPNINSISTCCFVSLLQDMAKEWSLSCVNSPPPRGQRE